MIKAKAQMQKEAIIEKFELMKRKGKINERTLQELGLKGSQSQADLKSKTLSHKTQDGFTERAEPQEEPGTKNL